MKIKHFIMRLQPMRKVERDTDSSDLIGGDVNELIGGANDGADGAGAAGASGTDAPDSALDAPDNEATGKNESIGEGEE